MHGLKPKDVAERLGCCTRTVIRAARKGELTCIRTPGGHRRFTPSSVEEYIRTHTEGGEHAQ